MASEELDTRMTCWRLITFYMVDDYFKVILKCFCG